MHQERERVQIGDKTNNLKNDTIMSNLLFIGNIGGTEIIIIAIVILLLFGGKKIPELMQGLGKGVKSFKKGMKEIEEDVENAGKDETK